MNNFRKKYTISVGVQAFVYVTLKIYKSNILSYDNNSIGGSSNQMTYEIFDSLISVN